MNKKNKIKKMRSTAFPLSLSTPFLKLSHQNPNSKPYQFSHSSSALQSYLLFCRRKRFLYTLCSSSSLCFNARIFVCSHTSKPRFHNFIARAAMGSDSADGPSKPSGLIGSTLQLGFMFGLWYLLNIYFNIYNKQVLKVYPFPATVTAFQFGFGTLMIIFMWGFNLYPRPNITLLQLYAVLPLAVAHTIGNLLTNVSLGKVAVSFTHTIKAMEPFFTVILSALFLAEKPTVWVVSSLIPIVGGVALASFTEASFNWIGFCSAMASNLTNQSRNVLSKKLMVNKEESLDNINLFSVITIISFILLFPSAILLEGVKFSSSYLNSAARQGLNMRELYVNSILTGFCLHAYQQVSYMILQMISPVTHSVGNCVKRVVVITSSVIFFKTPVSPINSLGTAMALAGVFLYSRAKSIKPQP